MVFLFRHSLELYLKAVIFWGNRLMNFDGDGVTEEELSVKLECPSTACTVLMCNELNDSMESRGG